MKIISRRPPIILLIAIILLLIPQPINTLSTAPLQFDPFPHLESAIINLIPTSTTTSYASTTYTFKKAKRFKPTSQNTFVGINSMDYNLNKPYYGGFNLYLSIGKSITDNTKMLINSYSNSGAIKQLKLSLLIVQPDFFYNDIFSTDYMYFSQYDPIQTFTLTNSSYSAAFYITYCDIQTLNTANGIMGMTVSNYASNYPDIDMEISFVGSLSYASVTYRVLVFYPLLAKEKYNIDVSVVSHMHLTSPYVFDVGFDKFKTGTSIFFMALKAFNYEAVNNATNDGFKYSHTFTSDSTYQIIASTTLDNQFNKMAQVYILIHRITCPPTHLIRGINRTSLAQECFDECYENQYVEYVATEYYHQCVSCGDVLCKSCQSATKCSSCVYGYELVEVTQTCALNPGFYDDGTGSVFLCSNRIAGCKYCTSTGATCTTCSTGYFMSSGTCKRCDTLASYCTNCTSTQCLSCASPKVLINATLCSDPIPNSSPPKTYVPCIDTLCFQCSPNNPSQCISCHSQFYKPILGKCQPICGDGIIISNIQICDDSNTIDNDGCSSNCLSIQKDFDCISYPHRIKTTMFTSLCHYTKVIEISLQKVYKHPLQNTINILLKNHQPQLQYIWQQIAINNELIKAFDVKLLNNSNNSNNNNNNNNSYWFEHSVKFVNQYSNKQSIIKQLINGDDSVSYKGNYQLSKRQSRLLMDENINYNQQQQNNDYPIVSNSNNINRLLLSQQQQPPHNQYSYILLQLSYQPSRQHINQPFIQLSIQQQQQQYTQQYISQQHQSLNHQSIQVQFNPTNTQRQQFTPINLPYEINFKLVTENNHLIQYYGQEYYAYAQMLFYVGVLVSICAMVMVIMSVVGYCVEGRNSRAVLVTIETVSIGQLAYFSMLQIGQLNPFFIHLLNGLKYINLFDMSLMSSSLSSQSQQIPRQLKGLNIQSLDISNNVNITLVAIFILMVIGGVLMLIDKVRQRNGDKSDSNSISKNVIANNDGNIINANVDINIRQKNVNKQIVSDSNNDDNDNLEQIGDNIKGNDNNENDKNQIKKSSQNLQDNNQQQVKQHQQYRNQQQQKEQKQVVKHQKQHQQQKGVSKQIKDQTEQQQNQQKLVKVTNKNNNIEKYHEKQKVDRKIQQLQQYKIQFMNEPNISTFNEDNNNIINLQLYHSSINHNQPQSNNNNIITQNAYYHLQQFQSLSASNKLLNQPTTPTPTHSRLYKISLFLIFYLSIFLFMFMLYKFLFFTCIQLYYVQLNKLTIINIAMISIIIIILLIFLVTSSFITSLSPLYNKLLQKLNDNNNPYDIRDILGKHKVIPKHKLIKIQSRFDRYLKLLPENQKPQRLKQFYSNNKKSKRGNISFCSGSGRINVKSWYIGIFFIEHVINIVAIVILSSLSLVNKQFFNVVPIALYVITLMFYAINKPYKHPNMYRLYLTYFVGIVIQALLLSRSIITNPLTLIQSIAQQQPSIGIYAPFTIAILLLVLSMIGLCYVFYSIKRFRCCQLQVEWQRVEVGQVIKIKLMELVKQQCGEDNACLDGQGQSQQNDSQQKIGKVNKNINNNNSLNNNNCQQQLQKQSNLLIPHNHDKNLHNNTNTNWQSSFQEYNSTSSTPFFNIPLNLRKQITTIHKMVSNNQNQQQEQQQRVDYTNREINREITSKLLKKEIKQKLLNSKIQRKIMYRQGVRRDGDVQGQSQQKWNVNSQLNKNKKKGSNNNNNSNSNVENNNYINANNNKNNNKNIIKTNKQQYSKHQSKQQQKLIIHDDNGQHVDYLYTDTKTYNVYEEFDMI